MDDLDVLARDFGFRPSGKSAPMRSDSEERPTTARSSSPFVDDRSHSRNDLLFNDVFGGPPKYSNNSNNKSSSMSGFDYDSIFKSSTTNETRNKLTSSLPVYDKPVYDEDIFDGLPGLKSKSTSTSARFDDDVFASVASSPKPEQSHDFDDLLGNLGKADKAEKVDQKTNSKTPMDFDDLLPGFGSSNSASSKRPIPESTHPPESSGNLNQTASNVMDDPFRVLESTSAPGLFSDPLEEINKLSKSGNARVDNSSFSSGVFDDLDPLNTFSKAASAFSFNVNSRGKDGIPSKAGSTTQTSAGNEAVGKSSFKFSESSSQKKVPVDNSHESHQTFFDMPNISTDSQRSFGQNASSPSNVNSNFNTTNPQADLSPRLPEQVEPSDDVWLTVSEIPLFTQPTRAPPPSRAPPPIPRYGSKTETDSFASSARKKGDEFPSSPSHTHHSQSSTPVHLTAKTSVVSSIDELEDFAMGRSRGSIDENTVFHSSEEVNANSAAAASAAAMKEAMDRAEAKFRHAKEVREREHAKATRSKEFVQLERDDEVRETQEREREKQERLEHEQREREREEEDRERRRLERERERAREIERENARRAVERATREARERAAAEACERAATEARLKAERAAVEKANAEARERAERAAVQRAQAEARERAAAEARERAERVAAEARERMNAEAREKETREKAAVARAEAEARRRAQRAAVEKAAAEARGRAAAEARERAAAAAAAARNQQKNDNDLESFFSMGSRASSAPRPGTNFSDPMSDQQSQSRGRPEGAKRTFSSGGASSNMKKASSTTNIVDDLTSIFGAAPSSGEFQEVEGESEERRRARLERHQRTQERAAKALAEKNQRDLQTQREQEERHRISEALDIEIRRWAAGKEGNLRALLSTLQYVLWPECGWQPVSLTDLITGASVKKAYRKATLCIHPDKVQQKGANLQQKYIAEKVFDLLKEAWNKFNSEELF